MNKEIEIDKPKVCCFDIEQNTILKLQELKFPIYEGSLGSKVQIPSEGSVERLLLLNHDFPDNLHEFDVMIADLDSYQTIKYKIEDHTREKISSQSSVYLLSHFPQTIFDPRPLASHLLKLILDEIGQRKHLIILFTTNSYQIQYEPVEISRGGSRQRLSPETYNIYALFEYPPLSTQKYGKEFRFCTQNNDLKIFLEKFYTKNASYNQTFKHKTIWRSGNYVDDEDFIPLIRNMNGDIISYIEINKNQNVLVLPQIENKTDLLFELLTFIAPSIYPDLFPYSVSFSWKDNIEYWLPNHSKLVSNLNQIQKEFDSKIQNCKLLMDQNKTQYQFLHDIISESGSNLVKSIIKYFEWLGYKNIKDMDSESERILEEDIQIEIPEGLLIIECKGIGGTSTDSDCSQISKIKHRRCKERGKFDVYALYIVNHQRFLPPLNRQNPPFTANQIRDAENDERGLLTTWQLFNLYFDLENGIISKVEARKNLLNYGFVELKPANLILIDTPMELFQKGIICIVNLKGVAISKDETIYIERNNKFEIAKIIDIQVNDNSISTASNGEVGLKLDKKIVKDSILWKKGSS
jgi:hypothetical protein